MGQSLVGSNTSGCRRIAPDRESDSNIFVAVCHLHTAVRLLDWNSAAPLGIVVDHPLRIAHLHIAVALHQLDLNNAVADRRIPAEQRQ